MLTDPGDLFLKKILQRNRECGFFLFVGPEGSDLEERAIRFFRASLCRQRSPDAEPCGSCALCVALTRGGFPDFVFITLRRGAREIQVDDVREALKWLSLRAHYGRKLLLISPAEALNPESANALLRSLEEPHEEAMIVMAAYREWQLLDTVRSRAIKVRFLRPLTETAGESAMERFFNRRPALCEAWQKDWHEVWITARDILHGIGVSRTPDWAFGLIRDKVEKIARDSDEREKAHRAKLATGPSEKVPKSFDRKTALWDLYLQVIAAQALDLWRVENGWTAHFLTPEEIAVFAHAHRPNWRAIFAGVHRLRRLLNETNVNPKWMLMAELLRYVRK